MRSGGKLTAMTSRTVTMDLPGRICSGEPYPQQAAAGSGWGKDCEVSQLAVSGLNTDSVGNSHIHHRASSLKDPCREVIISLLHKLIRSFRVENDARGLLLIKLE